MASKRIAGITGELILNVNKWSSGIKQAQKDSDALEKSLKPLTRAADTIGKPMLAAGAAITATFGAMTKVAADYGDKLAEVSSKTGITTQDLSKLGFAAEQNDTSFDGLTTGLRILSKNLTEAATGSKEQTKLFNALGISVKDTHGNVRPLNDVLLQTADVFKGLPDGPEKAAIAMKLFGKSGADLVPLLNQGSAEIKRLGGEAERMGLSVDGATAALGDEFNNALNRSKNALQGLSVTVGNVLLPSLTSLVNEGNEAIIWASGMAKEFPGATKAMAGMGVALTGAGGVLVGLGTLGTIAPKVAEGMRLIGLNASAAQLGIVGLGAALGITIGQFINSQIAASGYQKEIDGVIRTIAKLSGPLGVFVESNESMAKRVQGAQDTATASIKKTEEALKSKGVTVERGTMTELQYEQALAKAARAHFGLGDATKRGTDATTDNNKVLTDAEKRMQAYLASLTKANTAVDEHANKIKQLREAFASSLKPADDLEKTLKLLGDTVSRKDVLSVYGDQIIEATAKQKDHGFEVSNNIKLLNAMALGARAVNRELELQRASIGEVLSGAGQRTVGLQRADISDILPDTNTESRLENLIKYEKDLAREGSRAARELQDSWGSAMRGLSNGIASITVDALFEGGGGKLKKNMSDLNRLAKEFGIEGRKINETVDEYYDRVKTASKANKEFDDMFKHLDGGRNFFSKLGDLAKSTSKSMLDSLLKGFISPFTSALEGLGRQAATALGNILFGGSGGQASNTGGLLNIGGMLGGLFGKGGGGPDLSKGITLPDGTVLMQPTGSGIGGFTGQAESGLQSALNPVQMGLSVANTAIDIFNKTFGQIGKGRQAADQIVKSENAFFESVKTLLADSTLSTASKSKIFENTLSGLQSSSAIFGATDPNNQKVVNQMFANLAPFIANVRAGFERDMPTISNAGLSAQTITIESPVTVHFSLDGINMTAMEIRDTFIPELITAVELNIRGVAERLAQLLQVRSTATMVPTGI